ncbi:DUF4239 domain-containing protein [Acidisoma cellulosilytica]|uniref:DUF4239 domain-containing protein n=1 Tax=Acidisoma cellulosilyticum TaxID=2802395 RepID=A0A963Z1F0_9PROT|nr:DUF4239 domain-containing protein [Acidisoma cellulosilyticum]MCB8880227.1 DUF4239 domain-containing protein [Acidisoma cellulosilyticum]
MLTGFAQWLCLMPTAAAVAIAVLGSAALSVGVLFVAHAIIPHGLRSQHNDLAGFVLAIVGVIYAVLLAFIAVAVWESYADVGNLVQTEANMVDDLYRDTISLPPGLALELRQDLFNYAETVVQKEWPHMEAAMPAHLKGWRILDSFHLALVGYKPADGTGLAAQSTMLETLRKLYDVRRGRFHAAESDLPAVVWWNLTIGAGILITFSCLFGAARLSMHAAMVGLLGASIGLVLVVIVLLDNPFLGSSHVSVEPFQALTMAVETMDYPKPGQ